MGLSFCNYRGWRSAQYMSWGGRALSRMNAHVSCRAGQLDVTGRSQSQTPWPCIWITPKSWAPSLALLYVCHAVPSIQQARSHRPSSAATPPGLASHPSQVSLSPLLAPASMFSTSNTSGQKFQNLKCLDSALMAYCVLVCDFGQSMRFL